MSKVRYRPNPRAAEQIKSLPGVQNLLYFKAVQINGAAKAVFISRVKHTHAVTLPPYAASFKIRRVRKLAHYTFQAYNDDPVAFLVEFGAYLHHPTHPTILKYRPFGLGLDAVAATD